MMKRFLGWLLMVSLALPSLAAGHQTGDDTEHPYISPLFGSNMVLQREMPLRVWGWTEPGQKITVSVNRNSAKAVAHADGKWEAALAPLAAGGPYTFRVTGPQNLTFENVLVGDVWICAGQSNMAMGVQNARDAERGR